MMAWEIHVKILFYNMAFMIHPHTLDQYHSITYQNSLNFPLLIQNKNIGQTTPNSQFKNLE